MHIPCRLRVQICTNLSNVLCLHMHATICNSEAQCQRESGRSADDSPSHMELCICLHALTDWFLSLWRVRGGGVRHLVDA